MENFMKILRYNHNNIESWGVIQDNNVFQLKNINDIETLFDCFRQNSLQSSNNNIPLSECQILQPLPANTHIYCAGLNYRDHAEEIKMPVPKKPLFFSKSNQTLNNPVGEIKRPPDVRLLDYEIELGVVIGKKISSETKINQENISEYVLGLTIFNDVSARDTQLASSQWFLGKNYRGFAPVGPYIIAYDDQLKRHVDNLILKLQVFSSDGKPYINKKQYGTTANMIFEIPDLINALTLHFDLLPGDIIATGTPGGVALGQPSKIRARIAEIINIPQEKRLKSFLEQEYKKENYLTNGDTIISTIFSEDETINFGEQKHTVK